MKGGNNGKLPGIRKYKKADAADNQNKAGSKGDI